MSLDQETINQQEALLHQHRRRLDVLLQQQTRLGDYAPAHVRLEIEDVQAAIHDLKLELRSMGVAVADEPNDTVQPATIAAPSHLSLQEQLNRSRMLDRVETFWVKGVLEQSLYQVARIELGLEHAPAQVSQPWDTVIQQANQLNETIPPGKPVVAVFDDFLGELLILGAPGAGKTTTLLELARELIARARQNEQHPIPVVLNLSTWATKRQPLKLWLTEELNQRYDVPKKLAQEWVASNPLLLLLDGLDEVTAEHRDACVEAINEYRTVGDGFVPFAVCSRIADYEGLKIKLRVQGAVVIQSLTKLQVDNYLKQIGRPLAAVRAALRDDTMLWELMDNPLMLSIVALAYKDTSPAKLRASGTLDERRRQLFDDYIAAMFARPGRSIKTTYTRHKTLFSLSWLARTMVEQKQTILYIERMQPAWLHRWSRLGFAIRVGLLSALVFGLVGGLLVGLIGGLVFGLIGGLVGGLSSYPAEIQPVETLRWSWSAAGGGRHSSLVFALIFGLVGGLGIGVGGGLSGGLITTLIGGLIFGLIFGLVGWVLGWLVGEVTEGPITKRKIVDDPQFRRLVWYILAGGLVVGLLFGLGFEPDVGLLFGPIGGLAGALIFVLATKEIPTQTVDRKSMRRAAWAALVSGLLGGLVVGLLSWLNGGLISELGSSLIIGLLGGLFGGLAGTTFGWLAGWLSGGRRTQQAIPQSKALRRFARNALSGGLGSGLVVGLLGVLGGRPILGLLGGLGVGLLGGLGSGLLSGLIEGIALTRTVTNEGIRRSLRSTVVGGLFSGLIVGLLVGLLFGLVGGLVDGLVIGLRFGLVGGLLGGLLYGGATVLQHYTLRYLLYRNGSLPLRLVPFLDYCAERIFLRKVGGGYIFVHRLLMEHFAGLERGKAE